MAGVQASTISDVTQLTVIVVMATEDRASIPVASLVSVLREHYAHDGRTIRSSFRTTFLCRTL